VLEEFQPLVDTAAPAGMLLFGLLMGLRHSLEADHVAAISTLTADTKKLRHAPVLGALWGLGHTGALFAAGLVVLLLSVRIPEQVSAGLEFGVVVMLVFLAATTLTGFRAGRLLRRRGHSHVHAHPEHGIMHSHEHRHGAEHRHSHRPLIIGVVHGLAGSGALMVLLLSQIQSVPVGLAYIAVFGAGSVASMAGASTLIGLPFSKAKSRRLALALKYAAGIAALCIGAGMAYDLTSGVFQ
jgi:hypothetical protein